MNSGTIERWAERVLDVLFPPRCGGCGRVGTRWCAACQAQVQSGRGLVGARIPRALDGVHSAVVYAGPVRPAVHQLKYRGRRDLAPVLSALMVAEWPACGWAVDLIVPVPLHAARRAARGYNQAALLAVGLAAGTGLPCIEAALTRTRATAPQVSLDAHGRQANLQDAFQAHSAQVCGRRIVLVDDVCTTGATLSACGTALRAAGAAHVWAFTLARAVGAGALER